MDSHNKEIKAENLELLEPFTDLFGINYVVLNRLGTVIKQNETVMQKTDGYAEKAFLVDPIAWEDSKRVMESGVKKVQEEEHEGKYYLSVKQPLFKNGKVTSLAIISIDITKQKLASAAKDAFIMNMSHDLRTPFSGIYSITQILLNKETDESKKNLLKMIFDSAEVLLKIVNQTIEIISADEISSPEISTFNIKSMVEDLVKTMLPACNAKEIDFIYNCPDKEVKTDRSALYQVVTNLIGNAIKFTHAGKVDLSISFKKNVMQLSVNDTGVGISRENQVFIFDKFSKVIDSGTTGNFIGTGIGLYLVKNAVEKLHGTIDLESDLGKGSKFTVRIPLLAA